MKLLLLLVLFLCICWALSQVYDACGYVGSSNDPNLPEICLKTSEDCCYVTFSYRTYVYYSCISKSKLLENKNGNNVASAFMYWITDINVRGNITKTIYSQCTNNEGVTTSPEETIPENPYMIRSLSQIRDEAEETIFSGLSNFFSKLLKNFNF